MTVLFIRFSPERQVDDDSDFRVVCNHNHMLPFIDYLLNVI